MDRVRLRKSGDDSYVEPPVPIPNTAVKHINAESTCLETGWEDRQLPVDGKAFTIVDAFFRIHQILKLSTVFRAISVDVVDK